MKISLTCANCQEELALYGDATNRISTADLHEYAMKQGWQNIEITDYGESDDLYFCPAHFVRKEDINARPPQCG